MDSYERRKELENKIAEWEADDVYPGDQGYQRMLQQLTDLEEEEEFSEDDT